MIRPSSSPDPAGTDVHLPRRWHLGFPPAIEARYEADTARQRSRDLLLAGLVALSIYDLFLINDWISRPEVMGVALFWRLGVVSVYGLSVLALIQRGLPARWREAAMGSTTVVATGAACMIFRATTSPAVVYDPFLISLVFLAGNIVFQLRFVVALVSSSIGLAVVAYFVLMQPGLPMEARSSALCMLVGTAVFTVLALYRLERAERRAYLLIVREATRSEVAVEAAGRFAALSHTDALTQLANRRAFDAELPRRWNEAASRGQSLATLLIDIDHFKRFNDRYGHPAGDACLHQVAQLMREALREEDFIARVGGEEFAVLLQPATGPVAAQMAERLRSQVEGAAIPHDGADGAPVVTISLGVAVTGPPRPAPPASLVEAADSALYQAKRAGRNRVVQADDRASGSSASA